MPITPWTTYHGDQYIAQGFDSVARAIREAQAREIQQQQFDAQLAERARESNLGFYYDNAWKGDASARDWYGLSLRAQENEPYAPPEEVQKRMSAMGYYYAPQSRHGGSFYPVKTAADTPALGTDPTGTGNFYFDGRSLKQTRPEATNRLPASAVPMVTAELSQMQATQAQLASVDRQIAEHQAAIAQGDNRHGFLNLFSREDALNTLNEQRAKLAQQIAGSEGNISRIKAAVGGASEPPASRPAVQPSAPARPRSMPAPTPLPAAGAELPTGSGAAAAPSFELLPPELPAPSTVGRKPLDQATAQQFLQQAGGDRQKARELARAAGYDF